MSVMNVVPFAVENHVPDELKPKHGHVNDALLDLRGEVRAHRRRRFSYSVDVFRVRGMRARSNIRQIIQRRSSYLQALAVQGMSPCIRLSIPRDCQLRRGFMGRSWRYR